MENYILVNQLGEKNGFYGKTHSEESIEKMRSKLKGKLPINAKSVSIDNTIYPSATQASKVLGIATATVLNRIKSDKFPTYQYANEINA